MLGTITDGILKWKAAKNLGRHTRSQVVSVCSRKGGVGKTTTAVHLAIAVARWHHMRVLVIDMDPQGHVVTALSSVIHRGEQASPLSTVLMDRNGELLDACLPTELPNLWVVPADPNLEQTQVMLATRIGREFVLKTAMQKAEDMFDLIVIDCPPNLDTLSLNALVASQHVLVPTDLSLLGIEGVSDITDAVDTIRHRLGIPLEVAGIMVSRMDGRNKVINRELTRMLEQRFGHLVLDTRVPNNTAVARACLQGRPVYDFDPGATAASSYKELTDELLQRIDA
jgi:chromosome partitioning protein